MKGFYRSIIIAATSFSLAGCYQPNGQPNNTANGALLGGALGAGAGALIGGRHAIGGALIGGAFGAVAGGLIGNSMDQAQRERLRAQAPVTYQRVVVEGRPLDVNDIKELTHAGVSDDLIINDIHSSHAVYHLSTADIISLKQAGVSERVIDEMMRSPDPVVTTTPPPPPPQEYVVPAPGPDYVWVSGSWMWVNGHWVWNRGRWAPRPLGYHAWVGGAWVPAHDHYVWRDGHWR